MGVLSTLDSAGFSFADYPTHLSYVQSIFQNILNSHFKIYLLLAELRITEIFFSLQGEARTVGLPTVFIRLTGCPLRCSYCDTTYSFTGGEKYNLAAPSILERRTPNCTRLHHNPQVLIFQVSFLTFHPLCVL